VVAALAAMTGVAQASIGGFSANDGTETGPGVNCTTLLDWSCLTSSQIVSTLDRPASTDLAFTGSGSTENDPNSWSIGPGSIGVAKDEVNANWSYSYTDSAFANNYLALGFNTGSGSGDTDIDFELNQALPSNTYTNPQNTSVICRQNGDILIAFDVQSGKGTATVNAYKWTWT